MLQLRRRTLVVVVVVAIKLLMAKATAIMLDLVTVLKAFREETWAVRQHELIVLGNVICDGDFPARTKLYSSHQLMFNCGNIDIMETFSEVEVTTRNSGTLASVFVVPSTVEQFTELLCNMSLQLRKASLPHIFTRRVFFLSWPNEGGDINTVRELLLLKSDLSVLQSLKKLRQSIEIYVPFWRRRYSSYEITGLVEVYTSRAEVPVVQPLDSTVISHGELDLEALIAIASRRQDFRGVKMTVLGQPDDAFKDELTVKVSANGTVKFVSGTALHMLYDFMFAMNFTYTAVKGDGWIGLNANKSGLTGLGAQIMRKEADICISLNEFEDYRVNYVRYLQPIKVYPAYIHFIQPSLHAYRNAHLAPFADSVWAAIWVTWLWISAGGCVLIYKSRRRIGHIGTSVMYFRYKSPSEEPEYTQFCLWSVGAMCQNGWNLSSEECSLRMVCLSALLFAILTFAFYTSSVVASTSVPRKPVQSVSDLLKYNYHIFLDTSVPSATNGFGLDNTEASRIVERAAQDFTSLHDATRKVMEIPRMAFISGSVDFYAAGLLKNSERELCRADRIKAIGGKRMEAMIVRKSGSFREFFAYQTVVMIERGLAELYTGRLENSAGIRCESAVSSELALMIQELYLAFAILLLGCVMSALIIVIERSCGSAFRERQQRN